MFNLEEFEHNQILYRLVEKLNKYIEKGKETKIRNIIEDLGNLLNQDDLIVSSTYILSILAEEKPSLINESIYEKIEELLYSKDPKIRINSLIILGFVMFSQKGLTEKYLSFFIQNIQDKNNDIRENIYFFLHRIFIDNPKLLSDYTNELIDALRIESNNDNIILLLDFLDYCNHFNFEQLFDLREIGKLYIAQHFDEKESLLFKKLKHLILKLFPSLNQEIFWADLNNLLKIIDGHILIKKYNYTEINKKSVILLKDFIDQFKATKYIHKKIYFYVKLNGGSNIFVYEIEKDKLLEVFQKNERISKKDLIKLLSDAIDNESELRLFIETLIKLRYIDGYYSLLGFYYPYDSIKSEMLIRIQKKGVINLNKFNYLPHDFIKKIINAIEKSTKLELLSGKNDTAFYSLKKINEQINTEAAKQNSIDLKAYRDRLSEKDFIKLIKNLPDDYLTNFHRGTQWLTNLGLLNIKKEIENSKILGYFSFEEVSKKLKISKLLLVELFDINVDKRTGIFDNIMENFYYSKFINRKIDEIKSISDADKKEGEINRLAQKLNIEKSRILSKIDENVRLIGEEIKKLDEIKITEYLDKTGMKYDQFIVFIGDLGINYFKKGDLLILNERKIEEAKKDIKLMLVTKSKSEDHISLTDFDITSSIIVDLLTEIVEEKAIKGIFYNNNGEIVFYTEKGIRNLMLENSLMFSFNDFFYGKELNEYEINIIRSIFNDLIKSKILNGTFNEETLSFFSSEVVFAQDYNVVLDEFEKIVNNYIEIFNIEFQKIKSILIKVNQTIFPQEIKMIQEVIDNINRKYVLWRSGIEAFVRNANITLLKKQGYTLKRYKFMKSSPMKNSEVKLFEEDVEVVELIEKFNKWVKLFNDLEIKYGNIIFYQKRVIQDPEDKNNLVKLDELLDELHLKD